MSIHFLSDEKELLKRLQAGDEESFEQIFRYYYALLYVHAYKKIGDRELAKDIVQDLFAAIWKNRQVLNIETTLSNYLYTSVRNRVIDVWAKEKNRNKYLASLTLESTVSNGNIVELLQEKMLAEQIENTLKQLPPRVRQIFEMSRNQYLTYREIAQELQISEHTVRGYIKEALRALRFKVGASLWMIFVLFLKYF